MSEEILLKCPTCIFNTSINSIKDIDNAIFKLFAQMMVISSSQPSTAVLSSLQTPFVSLQSCNAINSLFISLPIICIKVSIFKEHFSSQIRFCSKISMEMYGRCSHV